MITFRRASELDVYDIFDWRNHELTRRYSGNTAPLDINQHVAWYDAAIKNPNIMLLIGYIAKMPIGVVRFDKGDEATISIYLVPDLIGLGLGKLLLQAALSYSGMEKFRAVIQPENIASIKTFEACGFIKEDGVYKLNIPNVTNLK